jgi:hypothetical protein
MSISETFHGYIETTQDSLLVFEACRRNILPKISRRLQYKERRLVRSGSVFVFDERDSGSFYCYNTLFIYNNKALHIILP